ncbi:MAG: SDR family oxidoreductase [Dehalococcoidia bacterium]|nr:SDR family oxidoreductase [Dehalococcoidia bacterium]
MEKPLSGKTAIVTGGGRGIGRAIALALADHGARVLVNDLGCAMDGAGVSPVPATEVVEEIRRRGGEALPNFDDVAVMENAARLVQQALDAWGRLDTLVTCAGILRESSIFDTTESEWDAVLNAHLKGTFACLKHAAIVMRQQRSGSIITVTSASGLYGNPRHGVHYPAAKAAVIGLTKVAARDMGRYGVRVNAVAPSAATRMTLPPEALKARDAQARATAQARPYAWAQPSLAELDPEDTAPLFVYLASDSATHINGQIFQVAGGVISLISQPRPVKTIVKSDVWTLDELDAVMPATLVAGLGDSASH